MNSAWYALRRTIPRWDADRNIAELMEFCKENSVDEVIVKVDTEEFTHGLPTVAWLDAYLPILRKIKAELERIGVVFSINPWVTLVHCDRGRDVRKVHPNVGLMVGHDGSQCLACACPLSDGWRELTNELWSRYASLEPAVLWVEDDIRLLNHQPAEYGCFCDLHLKAFSDKIGKQVIREELVAALLAPAKPHLYRKAWLDFNRDVMMEVARFLEQIVHSVSPTTKLGLMCSMPNHHALEGRDWKAFTSALSGSEKLVARPCMMNYSEDSLRGLYESEWMLRQTMHCLGRDAIIQTEVENVPFSLYSKSTTFTFLQMALSFALGSDGVTMNLFDHLGSPMTDTPEFGPMLKDKKPFLNALAQRCQRTQSSGIGLISAEQGAYFTQTAPSATWRDILPEAQGWRKVLGPLGFAYTFEQSSVTAISGQAIRALPDSQIKKLLSGGIVLDITAAQCLIEMGYSKQIGIEVKRMFNKNTEPLAAEEYHNEAFGGQVRKYITLSLPHLLGDPLLGEIVPLQGAQVISSVVDMDAVQRYPFLTVFENSLGGRIAVYPMDIERDFGTPFLHPYRKRQMEYLLKWLSKDNIPLEVIGGAYPLSFRNDSKDYSLVGVFNLSQDAWPSVTMEVNADGHVLSKAEVLTSKAKWASSSSLCYSTDGKNLRITWDELLAPASVVIFTLYWK